MDYIVILCTTNTQESAEYIASTLVEDRLVACVNILPQIKSVYRWKNKIVNDNELLLIIKTKKEFFNKVKNKIVEIHPYEVPEVISIDITDGTKDYLDWIASETSQI